MQRSRVRVYACWKYIRCSVSGRFKELYLYIDYRAVVDREESRLSSGMHKKVQFRKKILQCTFATDIRSYKRTTSIMYSHNNTLTHEPLLHRARVAESINNVTLGHKCAIIIETSCVCMHPVNHYNT